MNLNPEHVQWSREQFNLIAEGGRWGVPRSGLVFERHGEELLLIDLMPHNPAMSQSAVELLRYQEKDYQDIKRHFEAAGVTVDRTPAMAVVLGGTAFIEGPVDDLPDGQTRVNLPREDSDE